MHIGNVLKPLSDKDKKKYKYKTKNTTFTIPAQYNDCLQYFTEKGIIHSCSDGIRRALNLFIDNERILQGYLEGIEDW